MCAQALSCVWLFVIPWIVACQSPLPTEFSKQVEWTATSYSRGSFQPKDQTYISCVSCIGRQILCHCATWEALKGGPLLIPSWPATFTIWQNHEGPIKTLDEPFGQQEPGDWNHEHQVYFSKREQNFVIKLNCGRMLGKAVCCRLNGWDIKGTSSEARGQVY